MNIFTRIALAATVILALACKKTIDTPPNQITLNGSWNMKNVSGGLIGINLDYAPGEVIWNFNTTTNILNVTNNILTTGPKSIYAKYPTGSYSFYIDQTNALDKLFVDSVFAGDIALAPNVLNLDDGLAADGFLTVFEK